MYARLTPDAGEGTITVVPWAVDGRVPAPRGAGRHSDPGKRRANGRRACGQLRRRVVANACRFLWTLTYEDEPGSRAAVYEDLERFHRKLRAWQGAIPLCAVIERGAEHGRLHVHFVVDRFLAIEVVQHYWGLGFVWVGDDRQRNGVMGLRHAGRYMAKYLRKQIQEDGEDDPKERADGQHRYFCSRGTKPLTLRRQYDTVEAALSWMVSLLGDPETILPWQSEGCAPIVGVWVSWDEAALHRWRSYT